MQIDMDRLTGEKLLEKVEELKGLETIHLAEACGYVYTGKDGKRRSKILEFYKSISEALRKRDHPELGDITQMLPEAWIDLTDDERMAKIILEEVDPDILRIFARYDDYKWAVAMSVNAPADVLAQLKKEDNFLVSE